MHHEARNFGQPSFDAAKPCLALPFNIFLLDAQINRLTIENSMPIKENSNRKTNKK